MKVLAIDTATEACSVALFINGVVTNIFDVCPQQHAQRILPMIDQVLSDAKIKLTDLDLIAYGRGPGSFTGVRIATSTVLGLGLGTDIPVIGVSTLAAMAQQNYAENGKINTLALIDARMKEVYAGAYSIKESIAILIDEEAVLSPESLKERFDINAYSESGTGWEAYCLGSHNDSLCEKRVDTHTNILYPDAKYMLPLAIKGFESGAVNTVFDIKPVYLRDTVTWKKLPGK